MIRMDNGGEQGTFDTRCLGAGSSTFQISYDGVDEPNGESLVIPGIFAESVREVIGEIVFERPRKKCHDV
jgi:hypothetical protein